METVGLGNFVTNQATPLEISQGLGTEVLISPHLPQFPSSSLPDNCIHKEQPKLDGCSNRKRPRPRSNLSPRIFPICYQRSSQKCPDLPTSDPSGCSISCHLVAKTAGELDKTYLDVLSKEEQKFLRTNLKSDEEP